ncbi:hypothetical protein M9Y10_012877 [Tritrichomonas musculus]|uniref:C2 NT-type domain-containing protein n=1 Tax=Tritrichomonas musculus TaxID=1915356 RepID=A0ABR2IDM1_9EUKA
MSAKPPQQSKSKPATQQVTFKFSNLRLNNVPFYSKNISLKFQDSRFSKNNTSSEPVNNFQVVWTQAIEMHKNITRDSSNKLIPSIIDITVYMHPPKGGGKDEIAHGKLDLAQLVVKGNGDGSVELQSIILESSLSFHVDMTGISELVEVHNDAKPDDLPVFPEIHPVAKNSWFNMKHNPDLIEQDANLLVEAALKKKTTTTK